MARKKPKAAKLRKPCMGCLLCTGKRNTSFLTPRSSRLSRLWVP
jgi:hypothetical protein